MNDLQQIKQQYRRIDDKEYIIDVHGYTVDFELMWINEIKRDGGAPRRVVISYPSPFCDLVAAAVKAVFPNIRPYSWIDVQAITNRQLLLGNFICDKGLYLRTTLSYQNYTISIFCDETLHDVGKIKGALKEKLVELGRGLLINITPTYQASDDDTEEEIVYYNNGIPSAIGGQYGAPKQGRFNLGVAAPFTFDEFVQAYPTATKNALLRIMYLIKTICEKPQQGIHFSALLVGVPGTGKSMFATFAAERALQLGATVIYGASAQGGEITRNTMEFAIDTFPVVLFVFDEGEMLVPQRDLATTSQTLPFLMQMLDGYVSERRAASWGLIITTNRPHMIEPAFLRPVRLDEFVEFDVLTDANLSYSVFTAWCEKLGITPPDGIQKSWFAGKTHAECAAVAVKIKRMSDFGVQFTADDVKELLKEGSAWAKPHKIKGVHQQEGGMGFGSAR